MYVDVHLLVVIIHWDNNMMYKQKIGKDGKGPLLIFSFFIKLSSMHAMNEGLVWFSLVYVFRICIFLGKKL